MMLSEDYFKDKIINCFGDSTTWGDNGLDSGGQSISWTQTLRRLIPFEEVRNYGICGSRIAVCEDRDDSFIERFEQMDTDADDVVVFGGVNDFQHDVPLGEENSTDSHTFSGALNVMLTGLLKMYPTQNLVVITATQNNFVHPTKNYPNTRQLNACNLMQEDYVQRMKEICASYCIPVIDLFAQSGISPFIDGHERFMPDGLHYSQEGYQRLGRRITGLLLPYLL